MKVFSPAKRSRIIRDYKLGLSLAYIAEKHGCYRNYPSILARSAGVPPRTSPWVHARPFQTFYTEDQKAAIVADYASGMLIKNIVSKYNCSSGYPSMLARAAGVPLRESPVTEEERKIARRLWKKGKMLKDIAAELNRPLGSISGVIDGVQRDPKYTSRNQRRR